MANEPRVNYQPFLDDFEAALKEQDVLPDVRKSLVARFDAALQDAEQNRTSAALTLAHWKETVANMSQFFEQGETSATETSDLMRTFDGITQGLERVRDRENQSDDPSDESTLQAGKPSSSLPQGIPADLAAKLDRSGT